MSGKNNLLQEATIRRFMKLANVDSLTGNFIKEKFEGPPVDPDADDGDDDDETGTPPPTGDQNESFDLDDDLEAEIDLMEQADFDEEPEEELEDDLGVEEEPEMPDAELGGAVAGEADISLTEEEARLLVDLGERLASALGEGTGEEEDLESPEEPMDLDAEAPEEEAEEDIPPGTRSGVYENINKKEIVNEVLKRVARRLVSAKMNRK
jgi:hypothetical protein